jgi:hypothetical protein
VPGGLRRAACAERRLRLPQLQAEAR